MASLPYEERINLHRSLKPHSIDPFNEAGIPEKERNALLVTDFLQSYHALNTNVQQHVNDRYVRMGEEFGE